MSADTLQPLADGVWIDHAPTSMMGLQFGSKTTVLRLESGGLLVHSPGPLTPVRKAAVDALGSVEHLYGPNLFHHLYLTDWAAAFPDAKVHAPAGLARKQPTLRIDRTTGSEPEPAFANCVDELPIEGWILGETALVHRPSRTLVVADLVQNLGRPEHWWTKTYAKVGGIYDQVGLSGVLRWTSFRDKAAARRSVDRVLDAGFEQVVVGHGSPIVDDARDTLTDAYRWLKP